MRLLDPPWSRARVLAAAPILALGFLAACGGKQLGGNPEGGALIGPDGGTCVEVDLSSYDQSCSSDPDCTTITTGDLCSRSCLCGGSPVNVSGRSRYETAIASLPQGTEECGCPFYGTPRCVQGTCTLCGPSSTDPACNDGGTFTSDAGTTGSDGGFGTEAGCVSSSGPTPGTVTGVPSSCTGDVYAVVSASSCAFLSCCSSVVYAVCDGSSYSECDCDIPDGYTLASP